MTAEQDIVSRPQCAAKAAQVLPVHGQVPSRGLSRASRGWSSP